MNLFGGKYAPFTVLSLSIAFFTFLLAAIYLPVLQHTGGIIAYPLDDAYIHMAIAKNIALHHVWGISSHEFSSSSSSILYPLLLAGLYKIFGIGVGIPLYLNIAVAVIFIVVLRMWLEKQGLDPVKQMIALLLVILLVPLAPLVQCGMEHTLQLLLYFLFVSTFAEALENRDRALPWKVYVYGLFFITTRYESIAVVVISCLFLLFYRKWFNAILLGAICFLPILIFGLYALAHGNDFLPNSVLIKSAMPPLTPAGLYSYFSGPFEERLFIADGGYNMAGTQRLLLLLPLTYLTFQKQLSQCPAYKIILAILTIASLAHLAFMLYAGTPRYEAALVGTSIAICTTLLLKYASFNGNRNFSAIEWIKIAFGLVILGPIILRGWYGFDRASLAAISIYDQQVQMGHFVHQYYDQDPVAFNDIGAISYYAHGKNLDLWGLGDIDVARSRRKHYDSAEFLDSLSHSRNVKIAIVFEKAFRSLVTRWTKVASWTIPYNNASADKSVYFYAVDSLETSRLQNSLKGYQRSLPPGVIVIYY